MSVGTGRGGSFHQNPYPAAWLPRSLGLSSVLSPGGHCAFALYPEPGSWASVS